MLQVKGALGRCVCRAGVCTYPSGGAAFFACFEKSWEDEGRSNGSEKDSRNLVLPK